MINLISGFLSFYLLAGGVLITSFLPITDGTTADDDFTLSLSQKQSLDKLKESVSNKLPHEYMKQDPYLVRWLRAKNFDPAQAEEFLMKNLKWRKENGLDTIFDEDLTDMQTEYPYHIGSHDKEGKPVVIGVFGHWDLRNAEVTGRFDRLMRFAYRLLEEQETLIRKLQSEGKPVTRTVILFDMDGFNVVQHMCPRCINFFIQFYDVFENHFPNLIDKMFIINNHMIVNTVIQSVLSGFSPATRKITHLYGRNKAEFSKALLQYIDPDQLPEKYGGTKKMK